MSKADFENMLRKHNKQPENKEIDWNKQKVEWLEFISKFYNSIQTWLKPFKDNDQLDYKYEKSVLNEEYIGIYEVENLIIKFAGQLISLQPIGTLLIGSKGRIDMEGPRGRVQFILADKDSKGISINVSISMNGEPTKPKAVEKPPIWTWKIVLRENGKIAFEDFNEETFFFSALMEVTNG